MDEAFDSKNHTGCRPEFTRGLDPTRLSSPINTRSRDTAGKSKFKPMPGALYRPGETQRKHPLQTVVFRG